MIASVEKSFTTDVGTRKEKEMRMTHVRRTPTIITVIAMVLTMLAAVPATAGPQDDTPEVDYWLTILHNNDGESQVIDAGSGLEDFGGAARFKTLVDDLKRDAVNGPWTQRGAKRGVVMLSSGDNFLAGPEFNASLVDDIYYDAVAMELIGYDAVALGNHDFDFGPELLADFLGQYMDPPPYVSANLDFSGEPSLQAYVDSGVISPATIIKERGELIGVIGLETPNIPFISSPRNVIVDDALADVVNAQVDLLEAQGVDKIILTGHLQNIENDIELAGELDGVDVIIAGGGDELLASAGDPLIPGDEGEAYGDYPQIAFDMDGDEVPVVTTSGEYRYLGKLVVGFDKNGEIVAIDDARSGPVRVAGGNCNDTPPCEDAVEADSTMQSLVVDPVMAAVAELAETVLATSEVDLDGLRSSVRSMETNEGNLIADSFVWQATQLASTFGVPAPDVALANGGGIRNNTVIPAGDLTVLDTFDMLPFLNFLTLVPDIPRDQFKEILENTVACTQSADFTTNPLCGSGRFAQISGFMFEWSASGIGQILDADGNVTTAGNRVRDVVLEDGTVIVAGGVVQAGDPVNIAIVDFLARGGDQYPFRGAPFTNLGATYQQALANYLVDGLGGTVTTADYPEGGEGRNVELP